MTNIKLSPRTLAVQGVFDLPAGVLKIACCLMASAGRFIGGAFCFDRRVIDHLTSGFLDRAFNLLGGALDVLLVHDSTLSVADQKAIVPQLRVMFRCRTDVQT